MVTDEDEFQNGEPVKYKTVQITEAANKVLDRLKSKRFISKAGFLSRLVIWFDSQHQSVKEAFLDADKQPTAELFRRAVEFEETEKKRKKDGGSR